MHGLPDWVHPTSKTNWAPASKWNMHAPHSLHRNAPLFALSSHPNLLPPPLPPNPYRCVQASEPACTALCTGVHRPLGLCNGVYRPLDWCAQASVPVCTGLCAGAAGQESGKDWDQNMHCCFGIGAMWRARGPEEGQQPAQRHTGEGVFNARRHTTCFESSSGNTNASRMSLEECSEQSFAGNTFPAGEVSSGTSGTMPTIPFIFASRAACRAAKQCSICQTQPYLGCQGGAGG